MLKPADSTVALVAYGDIPGAYMSIGGRWRSPEKDQFVSTTVAIVYVSGDVAVVYTPDHNCIEIIRKSMNITDNLHWLFGYIHPHCGEITYDPHQANELFVTGQFEKLFDLLRQFGQLE